MPRRRRRGDALPLAWVNVLGRCEAACTRILSGLAPEDAAALMGLPDRVARTVSAIWTAPELTWDQPAKEVLDALAERPMAAASGIAPGEHACTVYWYGFLDQGGSRVGRHRCRIDRDGEGITVTKITGDGYFARLEPLGSGASIAVGRTYLPEQDERRYDAAKPANSGNDNFGNRIGLAFASGCGLVIIGADLRGFTEPDDTYFDVLVVE